MRLFTDRLFPGQTEGSAATLIEFHTLASAKDLSMNTFGFSFPWSYGVQLLSGDSLALHRHPHCKTPR